MEEEFTYGSRSDTQKISEITWENKPLWMPRDFSEYFGMACALTGETENLTLDHVLPREKGKRRNSRGNLIPLNLYLNSSKSTLNIFLWFYDNKERLALDQERFDLMIYYLASIHGMTSMEYRDYYFKSYAEYCEVNPHVRRKSATR